MNLNNIKSGFNLSKMNENFQRIVDMANNQVLYRNTPTGQPNQMEVDLDMNGHKVYNNGAPTGPYDLVRWIDVVELGGNVVPGPPPPPPAPPPGPGPGPSEFFKIAVIGDSLSGQQALFDSAWPSLLERSLNASGANVQVKNFAINGYTYNSAANTAVFGSKTMLQSAIDYEPQVVIVALGANDAFRAVDHGNANQVIAEAQALYTALRTALPDTPIYYGSMSLYDPKHANLNALVNRHIMPAWWQKKSAGLLANVWCKEMQNDPVASNIRSAMQYWTQLDNNVRGFQEINGTIIIPMWTLARLGLTGVDGLHPGAIGHKMMHGAVRKYLQGATAFRQLLPDLSDQGGGEFNDFDLVFNGLLQDNGTEYITKSNPSTFVLHAMRQFGPWSAELCDSWFYPSKGSVVSSNLQHNRTAPQVWMIRGSKPNAIVQVTGNETSWLPTNLVTDSRGDTIECGSYAGLPNGNYTLRYRVDDEAYGPLTITVTGDEGGGGGGDFAKRDGSNAFGTWPISISGTIEMSKLSPVGGPNQGISWVGSGWAPRWEQIIPGWQMLRESATSIRIFPISDGVLRCADGTHIALGANGNVIPLGLSGEFPGGAYQNYFIFYSPAFNRLHASNTLPVLRFGVYHFPGDDSFICLGRVYLNAAGQLEDTDTHRGVCSAYNQAPRSIRFAPRGFDGGLTAGQSATISVARFTSCFPGALVDLSAFGQAGATASASYSRVSFNHDTSVSSTVGGDLPAVSSHSLRSITSATGSGQDVSLNVRCESGTVMIVGNSPGVQGRGLIYHNW